MFIVMFPCLGATLIAVSRIMDARHHPFDVITGSLLGILCATISYRQYFPSLAEPWKKGRGYPGGAPYGSTDSTAALTNPEEERFREHGNGSSENPEPIPHPEAYQPSVNPFASNAYPRHHDGNWSSSSEEDVTNGYEMQQGYTRTHNPSLGGQLPTYEPGMAYQSQTQPVSGPTSGTGPLYPEATIAPAPGTRAHNDQL
jgi:diacylglycerol diphosphate phosphatase/phosphatidate phosphatase